MMISTANKSDKKAIQRFYKKARYSARFIGLDTCCVIKENDNIVASVIVSKIHPKHQQYFLHGLVVANDYQRQGLAHRLIAHCLKLATYNHHVVVCFADKALSAFYQQHGFTLCLPEHYQTQLTGDLFGRFSRYNEKHSSLSVFIFNANNGKNDDK